MITNDNKQLVQRAIEFALKHGAQAARATLYTGTNTAFEVRDMQIDRLSQAAESGLTLQLFVDERFGSFSTNRLTPADLETFIRNGIASTRYLTADPDRTLPDPALYYYGDNPDLALADPTFDAIQPDEKKSLALQLCAEMIDAREARLISATASYADERAASYTVASNGFEGERNTTSFTLVATASIRGNNNARPEAYWFDASIDYNTLTKTGIGTRALQRALARLGQQKIASGRYTMIVDNLNSARLLSPLINAIYGSAIQQRNSFLIDKLEQQVLSERVTIIDEPHLKQARGARYFDAEGVATSRRPVFEQGILKTYYIDTYHARRLAVAPTVSTPSVLTMQLGDVDTDGLMAAAGNGILVTGFNGGNSNSTTADFSFGIEGFRFENGRPVQPISEMNITGNLLALWSNLTAVGNDFRHTSAWRIPSLAFADVAFSGV